MPLSIISSRSSSLGKIIGLFYQKYSKSQFEHFVNVAKSQIKASHFYEGSVFTNYHKILDDCIWSIQNKREMQLIEVNYDYTSISSHVEFPQMFFPIQILYHRGVVHVSGFIKENNQLLILGLEQIEKYKLTNDSFDNSSFVQNLDVELSKRFGITQNIDNEIYDIEIEFTERTGNFVSKQFWNDSQEFEKLENKNFMMKMTCGINRELIGWIFHWMSNAKVIKPEILKALVVEKYTEMVNLYEQDAAIVSNNSFRPL